MDKFSKVQKSPALQDKNTLYDGKYVKVIDYKDWEIVTGSDRVFILPYLRDEGYIIMYHEYIPSYSYRFQNTKFKDVTNFITIITEKIEKGEKPEDAVRRGLYEEAGIVLSNMFPITIDKNLYIDKGSSNACYICLLDITYNDYKVVTPPTDNSEGEKKSQVIKVSLGDLDDLKIHDLITDYMVTKLKYDYKL